MYQNVTGHKLIRVHFKQWIVFCFVAKTGLKKKKMFSVSCKCPSNKNWGDTVSFVNKATIIHGDYSLALPTQRCK